ncbi:MAG: alpha/beta hydrolase, partial [Janthinobacterium sp.]
MIEASIKSVQCISPAGLHTMSYKEWGAADNPNVLVCAHGVTRVADDFDNLARAMASDYRVICPDVVGRGRSGWLANPQFYRVPQYVSDMVTLLARVLANGERQTVDWFGTSMGGLIGLGLA